MIDESFHYDAIIAGAGVAGIRSATELSNKGMRVALVDHTINHPQEKSLFLNSSKLPGHLMSLITFHPIHAHQLINADNPTKNWGKSGNFNTGAVEYAPLYQALMAELPSGVDVIPSTVTESSDDGKSVFVTIGKGRKVYKFRSRYLVDATGDRSIVSRRHTTIDGKTLIEDDPLVAWMIGVRGIGRFDPDTVYDPIGKDIGGTSWVTPLSSTKGDVIASGVSRLSQANLGKRKGTLDNLIHFCETNGICKISEVVDRLGGVIRSEPISLRDVSKSNLVWQIGQSAGMADPLMGEAFTPAYLHPSTMATFIAEGRSPKDFYHYWRYASTGSMFDYDLMLSMLKRRERNLKKGVVGSSAAIYQVLTEQMSDAAVELALKERRIPIGAYIPLLTNFLCDVQLRKTFLELIGIYAQTLINENFLPRLSTMELTHYFWFVRPLLKGT